MIGEGRRLSSVMPVCNLSELIDLLPKGRCLLGLDPGSTVIGVAVSDPGLSVASPLGSIVRTQIQCRCSNAGADDERASGRRTHCRITKKYGWLGRCFSAVDADFR